VIDIFPTMAAVLNRPLPEDRKIDGRSLLPLLREGGGASPHKYLFHMWDSQYPKLESSWAVSTDRYKLVQGEELFDVLSDPGESKNIGSAHPDIVRDLREQHEIWFRDVTRGQDFEPATIQVGRADENPVELQAGEAIIDGTRINWVSRIDGQHRTEPVSLREENPSGTVNYTWAGYDWDSIDRWSSPGQSARWKLDVVREGTYEVVISYGCHARDAGGKFRLSVRDAYLDGVVEPTLNHNVFWARKLGDIRVERGPTFLEVKALSVPGKQLMALNKIWLKRQS
jgi:arylsulfatase A